VLGEPLQQFQLLAKQCNVRRGQFLIQILGQGSQVTIDLDTCASMELRCNTIRGFLRIFDANRVEWPKRRRSNRRPMLYFSKCYWPSLALLFVSGVVLIGCRRNNVTDVGTATTLQLPESEPAVLTKDIADRIQVGMSQEQALSILQAAARDIPSAKSTVDVVVTQGKLNNVRFDLTVIQGKRKLALAFKNGKLVDKMQDGLD
jgi:hypothetical protein